VAQSEGPEFKPQYLKKKKKEKKRKKKIALILVVRLFKVSLSLSFSLSLPTTPLSPSLPPCIHLLSFSLPIYTSLLVYYLRIDNLFLYLGNWNIDYFNKFRKPGPLLRASPKPACDGGDRVKIRKTKKNQLFLFTFFILLCV
jgi:hypothetical protein